MKVTTRIEIAVMDVPEKRPQAKAAERKLFRGTLLAGSAVVALGLVGVASSHRDPSRLAADAVMTGTPSESTASENEASRPDLLESLRDFPSAVVETDPFDIYASEAARACALHRFLEEEHRLHGGTLERELEDFATKVLDARDTDPLDRARALLVTKEFAEAESAALSVLDDVSGSSTRVVSALEVAGIAAIEISRTERLRSIPTRRALGYFLKAAALTDKSRDEDEWARLRHGLALVLHHKGSPITEIEPVIDDVVESRSIRFGMSHPRTLAVRVQRGECFESKRNHHRAVEEHRSILGIRAITLGPDHPDTLLSRRQMAAANRGSGRNVEAAACFRELLPILGRVLGPEHPETILTRAYLAKALQAISKDFEAEIEFRGALEARKRVLEVGHPDTLESYRQLGGHLMLRKKFREMETEWREMRQVSERALGVRDEETLWSRIHIARALYWQERYQEALTEAVSVSSDFEAAFGAEDHGAGQARKLVEKLKERLSAPMPERVPPAVAPPPVPLKPGAVTTAWHTRGDRSEAA